MKIAVVCGPPGSGKSTYVRERMQRGDLIVDMDELYRALSGLELRDKPDCLLPFVAQARDAVIYRLKCKPQPRGVSAAWIVTASADKRRVKRLAKDLGAELVILDVSPDECVERMRAEGRESGHIELMDTRCREWWNHWLGGREWEGGDEFQ